MAIPLGGRLTDSVGPRQLVLSGVAFALLGNLVLTQVASNADQALLALSGVPRGIGMGLVFPALLGAGGCGGGMSTAARVVAAATPEAGGVAG